MVEKERKKIISFNTVKEVSHSAVITAWQIAPAREIIWIFFFRPLLQQSAPKQRHPSGLICLGRVPLGGGSTRGQRGPCLSSGGLRGWGGDGGH